jgi:hypothetical protein
MKLDDMSATRGTPLVSGIKSNSTPEIPIKQVKTLKLSSIKTFFVLMARIVI